MHGKLGNESLLLKAITPLRLFDDLGVLRVERAYESTHSAHAHAHAHAHAGPAYTLTHMCLGPAATDDRSPKERKSQARTLDEARDFGRALAQGKYSRENFHLPLNKKENPT